jgi:hypothetical protein
MRRIATRLSLLPPAVQVAVRVDGSAYDCGFHAEIAALRLE